MYEQYYPRPHSIIYKPNQLDGKKGTHRLETSHTSDALAGDTEEQMLDAGIAFGVGIHGRGVEGSGRQTADSRLEPGFETVLYIERKYLDALYTVAVQRSRGCDEKLRDRKHIEDNLPCRQCCC